MKESETIVEMITRFTDIVNGLEALENTYKESEKVIKILRSLPSKWHTKVTTIQSLWVQMLYIKHQRQSWKI